MDRYQTTPLDEQLRDGLIQRFEFTYRVSGKAKPYSDLDLAIIDNTPLALLTRVQLEEAFSSSLLPWKVDVLDWASSDSQFRDLIFKNHIVIQEKA